MIRSVQDDMRHFAGGRWWAALLVTDVCAIACSSPPKSGDTGHVAPSRSGTNLTGKVVAVNKPLRFQTPPGSRGPI